MIPVFLEIFILEIELRKKSQNMILQRKFESQSPRIKNFLELKAQKLNRKLKGIKALALQIKSLLEKEPFFRCTQTQLIDNGKSLFF